MGTRKNVPIIDHAIVFGLGLDKEDRKLVRDNWQRCNPCKFIDPRCKGMAPVTVDDIRYVTGYCQKKLTGKDGQKEYIEKGLVPPFSVSSQFLGLSEFLRHKDFYCGEDNTIRLWTGQKLSLPRYLLEKGFGNEKLITDKYEYYKKLCDDFGLDIPDYKLKGVHRQHTYALIDNLKLSRDEEDTLNFMRDFYAKRALNRRVRQGL